MSIDYAISLVRNEADATILDQKDLAYVHAQLRSEHWPRHNFHMPWINKASPESLDRIFDNREVVGGTKVMFVSYKEAFKASVEGEGRAKVLWVKVAPVEEFVS